MAGRGGLVVALATRRKERPMPYPNNFQGGCSNNCGREATHWVGIERFGEPFFARYPHCEPCADELVSNPAMDATSKPILRR